MVERQLHFNELIPVDKSVYDPAFNSFRDIFNEDIYELDDEARARFIG